MRLRESICISLLIRSMWHLLLFSCMSSYTCHVHKFLSVIQISEVEHKSRRKFWIPTYFVATFLLLEFQAFKGFQHRSPNVSLTSQFCYKWYSLVYITLYQMNFRHSLISRQNFLTVNNHTHFFSVYKRFY